MKIILGQGNIGTDYSKTRHNIGFEALDFLAKQYGGNFKEVSKFRGLMAEIRINNEKVILFKPTTFYNLTGFALRLILDYYKINHQKDLLVIHDDLATEFGNIKVRDIGSAGGNNGLRSIISQFDTKFWRIKVGTLNQQRDIMTASDFVLSKFNNDEAKLIPDLIKQISLLTEQFINNELTNSAYKIKKH